MKTRASLAITLVVAVAAAALPGTSSADHQTAKNGCTSLAPVGGSLTSGSLPSPQTTTAILFRTWWETQSVDPLNRDRLQVQTNEDGAGFQTVLTLNQPYPFGAPVAAAPDVPFSNVGPQQRPAFGGFVSVPVSATGSLRVRFLFDSVDAAYNGFRGWGIDDVQRVDGASTFPFDSFESGFGTTWTASGQWTIASNSALPAILSPTINPNLITLGAGDDGVLPVTGQGSRYAWFGQAATGTYCGDDAAHPLPPPPNVAPTAAFNVNPAAPKTSDTVTFDGSPSSDPEGALASHTWDFGDGSPTATGATASHVYRRKGTYTVTLTVADAVGATSTATHVLAVRSNLPDGILVADKLDDLPHPKPFEEVNVEPIEGEVFVDLPGGAQAAQVPGLPRGFIPLTQAAQLPIGSILETSRGKVVVESARHRRGRRTQQAEFFDGRFQMRQPRVRSRNLVTEMVLKGGGFRSCPRARRSGVEADESQRRRRNSRVRRLWGNGRGRFRTRGRYSSAAVRGTTWLVEDRCNGTLTRLPRRPRTSVVDVRDLVTGRTVRLRAGRRYLARPKPARR